MNRRGVCLEGVSMKLKAFTCISSALLACMMAGSPLVGNQNQAMTKIKNAHGPFTGKVNGNKVRLRSAPDVESAIVRELSKDDLLIITGEKNDFYAVEPPTDVKAYIFRSFVLDGNVEGNRVNVRLAPNKDAPIVAHMNTGERVEGKICKANNKWLEIPTPNVTRFYVAKEFIDYAGGPDVKLTMEKRKASIQKLMESTSLLAEAEMRKPFTEIDIARVEHNYSAVIKEYEDFPAYVDKAKQELAHIKEQYLQKKIQFLETKAKQLTANAEKRESQYFSHEDLEKIQQEETILSATDRMKAWEPVEESLFLTWSAVHHAKNMDDFYEDQKLKANMLTGILEPFKEPIKNKPGEYVVKKGDITVAYVYSTLVNLQDFVGRQVNLHVASRPNNNFAFPAFFVLDAE